MRNKIKACEDNGFLSSFDRYPADLSEADLLGRIDALNRDPRIHGILVQLPLPDHIHETTVLDAVAPLKDVDCFQPENVGLMVQGRPRFLPCTPHGVQVLLRESGTTTRMIAQSGSYQQMLQGKVYQLVRVTLAEEASAIPEISANKYMLWIRFMCQDGDEKPRLFESDTAFDLTLCNF